MGNVDYKNFKVSKGFIHKTKSNKAKHKNVAMMATKTVKVKIGYTSGVRSFVEQKQKIVE